MQPQFCTDQETVLMKEGKGRDYLDITQKNWILELQLFVKRLIPGIYWAEAGFLEEEKANENSLGYMNLMFLEEHV